MLSKPMILKRFFQSPEDRTIRDLYGAIVAQARSLAFYTSYGVPDTVQGRFDLIVLHLVLLLARLDREAASARSCSTCSAGILTAICVKWASVTSLFQNGCSISARRF